MRILLQDNIGSHYRSAIYQLLDRELGCDFCFGDRWDDIKKMDYSVLSHEVTELHNVFFRYGYYQKGMMRLLKKTYDTYIVVGEIRCISTWFFLILRKAFYPRKRVFLWAHGMLGKENTIKRWIIRFFYALADGAFIYNERSCHIMAQSGIPADKLIPIYNSLDYEKQLALRQSLQESPLYENHFGNNNKNIVFIGRLTAVKRFDILLNAVAKLREQNYYVNVTFVGDGVERGKMESMANSLGISDQIWFYGASYDEACNAELIYNADLCVSPGNIGLTAMHVLMFGCPAITNDDFNHQMPEFEAIRDGITGCFFKAGDCRSLAERILHWLTVKEGYRDEVRSECYKVIDTKWNPYNQIRIIKQTLGITQ